MEKPKTFDYSFKLLLLGNQSVGKTCILQRYLDDVFTSTEKATIAIDFRIKIIEVRGKRIQLTIWDTGGQERFRALATSYYRGAMGIVLVYDVTNQRSFDQMKEWLEYVKAHASPDVEKILVGNKCDSYNGRVVSEEKGKALADSFGMSFFETSSKTRIGIHEMFEHLATLILNKQSMECLPKEKDKDVITTAAHPEGVKDKTCSWIDFKIKTIELQGKRIKLQIWDTAGQERFHTITTSYYRGAMGILLVYDITNQKSFDNITKWLQNIEMHASVDVERLLVGNKCDCEARRVISKERGQQLAASQGIPFLETSAKSDTNVYEAFETVARAILKKYPTSQKGEESQPELKHVEEKQGDAGTGGGGGCGC